MDGGAAPTLLRVGVADEVNPAGAPVPRTAAERFVYRQVYETLVRVDCAGTVLPGIAVSWSAEEDGRAWRFRLREGGVFSDGSPLTGAAVVESWSEATRSARVSTRFASVTALGERELRVELRAPSAQPYLFADPEFAIARRSPSAAWPAGSGAFRVEATAARMTRLVRASTPARAPATIEVRAVSGADARAALDAGVDVLVTADRAAVAYARALPGYSVAALPWNRTYALATPARPVGTDTLMGPSLDVLNALARTAADGTRPATPPFWWDGPECRTSAQATPASARASARAIVYPRGDAVARDVAERLVALAWPAERAPAWLRGLLPTDYARAGAPVAAGLEPGVLLDSLRAGSALAAVVALPRNATATCGTGTDVAAGSAAALLSIGGWQIMPLLDAHDHLVHRGNFGRLTIDGDGTLVFSGGGP